MHSSTISPTLVNIFIEPLLQKLAEEFDTKNIFGFADDIAVCTYSVVQLRKDISIINVSSEKEGIPLRAEY